MNSRLRLGPPKHRLAADLGQPDAADELAFRCPHGHTAVAEAAAAGIAIARHPEVPVTSQRAPSGPHLMPSIMESVNSCWYDILLSAPTSTVSRAAAGPVAPGPGPMLMTYSFL